MCGDQIVADLCVRVASGDLNAPYRVPVLRMGEQKIRQRFIVATLAQRAVETRCVASRGKWLFQLGPRFGVPLTERGASHTGLPDRIVIFRGPILRTCTTAETIAAEVRDTVVHELGHHLGLSDQEMPY